MRSAAPSSSKITRPERSGGLNAKPRLLPSRGSRSIRSIFDEFLLLGLGLARARSGAEAGDEVLEPRDLGLLALDRPPERELALSLLRAPGVPGALEEAPLAALELEHGGPDRLEEPAVVSDQDDRRVERLQVRLEPFQRLDVEVVGRLVEQQQVGVAGERARQRGACQLTAGERAQVALEVAVAEAEAMQRRVDAVAPVVAAGVLEPRLGLRVGAVGRFVGRAARHRLLERGQLLLQRKQLGAARQHVVAQRDPALARRPLVVQRQLRALGEYELAAVDRRLPRQHAQQRRLAGAIAARERQPLAPFELERHATQQGLARHVLGEIGCKCRQPRRRGIVRAACGVCTTTLALSVAAFAISAQFALASESDVGHDGGEGWWGETNDVVVTNVGFILIAFFPLFILFMSLLQGKLEKRKDERKAAVKARAARADLRGGW